MRDEKEIMDEILNIKTKFEIKTTEKKPAGAVALRIVSEAQNPFLKTAGDFFFLREMTALLLHFIPAKHLIPTHIVRLEGRSQPG